MAPPQAPNGRCADGCGGDRCDTGCEFERLAGRLHAVDPQEPA